MDYLIDFFAIVVATIWYLLHQPPWEWLPDAMDALSLGQAFDLDFLVVSAFVGFSMCAIGAWLTVKAARLLVK